MASIWPSERLTQQVSTAPYITYLHTFSLWLSFFCCSSGLCNSSTNNKIWKCNGSRLAKTRGSSRARETLALFGGDPMKPKQKFVQKLKRLVSLNDLPLSETCPLPIGCRLPQREAHTVKVGVERVSSQASP